MRFSDCVEPLRLLPRHLGLHPTQVILQPLSALLLESAIEQLQGSDVVQSKRPEIRPQFAPHPYVRSLSVLIYPSEIVIQPVKNGLYQLRTLLRDVVRRVENNVALIVRRRAQHGEEGILRLLEREAEIVTPIHHQHRLFHAWCEIGLVGPGRRRKQEVAPIKKNRRLQPILQQGRDNNPFR
jgi:hypothetical protein